VIHRKIAYPCEVPPDVSFAWRPQPSLVIPRLGNSLGKEQAPATTQPCVLHIPVFSPHLVGPIRGLRAGSGQQLSNQHFHILIDWLFPMDFGVEQSCFVTIHCNAARANGPQATSWQWVLDEPWSNPITLTTPHLDISRIPTFLVRRNESHVQPLHL